MSKTEILFSARFRYVSLNTFLKTSSFQVVYLFWSKKSEINELNVSRWIVYILVFVKYKVVKLFKVLNISWATGPVGKWFPVRTNVLTWLQYLNKFFGEYFITCSKLKLLSANVKDLRLEILKAYLPISTKLSEFTIFNCFSEISGLNILLSSFLTLVWLKYNVFKEVRHRKLPVKMVCILLLDRSSFSRDGFVLSFDSLQNDGMSLK